MVLNLMTANLKLGLVEFNATFFFQIANTFILFLILKKLLFEPVTKFISEREDEIASNIKSAKDREEAALKLKEEYRVKIKGIESKGKEIIKEARTGADKQASEIIQKARDEEKELRLANQKELEREKVKAINELKDEISELTIMTASKVIEKDLSAEDHKVLIDQFIDEVGDVKWQN